MKSRILSLRTPCAVRRLAESCSGHRISVFAAQSSFFICISAIPLSFLLLSLSRLVAPYLVSDLVGVIRDVVPEGSRDLFDSVVQEIGSKADMPLVSTAALSALWSSSKGLTCVVRGLSEVYGTGGSASLPSKIVKTLVYTALFIAAVTATLVVLVFGNYLARATISSFGDVPTFIKYKEITVFLVLALFFAFLYRLVAKGAFSSPLFRWDRERRVTFSSQMPGALASSAGWIASSFVYSLYFRAFPRFSYLYGSLAAVVFFMLWVYFCVFVLLFGAELNRFCGAG